MRFGHRESLAAPPGRIHESDLFESASPRPACTPDFDPRQTTAKARATFMSSFERLVDPDGKLPHAERLRRAEAARKAHYARLARLST
jgi:hypothetical protein